MKKIILVFIFALLSLVVLANFVFNQSLFNSKLNKTRDQLKLIASNASLLISADEVFAVPLQQRSEGNPQYLVIYEKLLKIKEANPVVKYAYIMTTTTQAGILQSVVDADPLPEIITARCTTSLPGDKYDARQVPEMLEAFNGPTADKEIIVDQWGTFVSGYAPIRDRDGKSVAILGVDSDARELGALKERTKTSGYFALAIGILFTSVLIFFIKKDFPALLKEIK